MDIIESAVERSGGDQAAPTELVRDSVAGALAEHGAAPTAAEPERSESPRESLERARDEMQASGRDADELDEIFKPLAGKMAEGGYTGAGVVRELMAVVQGLAQDPRPDARRTMFAVLDGARGRRGRL